MVAIVVSIASCNIHSMNASFINATHVVPRGVAVGAFNTVLIVVGVTILLTSGFLGFWLCVALGVSMVYSDTTVECMHIFNTSSVINGMLTLSIMFSEILFFGGVLTRIACVSMFSSTATSLALLGSGAMTTTLVLLLMGLYVTLVSMESIYSSLHALLVLCGVFFVLHSFDHAVLASYVNTNVLTTFCISLTTLHCFHVVVVALFVSVVGIAINNSTNTSIFTCLYSHMVEVLW